MFLSERFNFCSIFKFLLHCLRALPTTPGGLAFGRDCTNARAGAKRPNSDKTFCGNASRLTPNRLLYVGLALRFFSSIYLVSTITPTIINAIPAIFVTVIASFKNKYPKINVKT